MTNIQKLYTFLLIMISNEYENNRLYEFSVHQWYNNWVYTDFVDVYKRQK